MLLAACQCAQPDGARAAQEARSGMPMGCNCASCSPPANQCVLPLPPPQQTVSGSSSQKTLRRCSSAGCARPPAAPMPSHSSPTMAAACCWMVLWLWTMGVNELLQRRPAGDGGIVAHVRLCIAMYRSGGRGAAMSCGVAPHRPQARRPPTPPPPLPQASTGGGTRARASGCRLAGTRCEWSFSTAAAWEVSGAAQCLYHG